MDFIVESVKKEKEKLFLGIDNGKQGALVAIDLNENIRFTEVMPLDHEGEYDIKKIYSILTKLNSVYDLKVCLEKAYTMPLNGCKSNFTAGKQFGSIITMLEVTNISFEIVGPKNWQKVIFQGQTVKDTKDASISYCLKKWPEANWKRTEKCSKYHDGLSDAANISLYFKRNLYK